VRICIVLGAGATFANGKYFRPTNLQRTLPPLDYTFFRKISDLGIHVPRDLVTYAAALPTGSPFTATGGENRMEEFLRDLFHDFLSERATATSRPVLAYRQMIEIYAHVLRETTDRHGPVGRLIAEAAACAENVDVITFNHDLVIENEIFKRARLRPRWCIERGYGAFNTGRSYLTTPGRSLFPQHSASCDHSRSLVIHKMHGSLNWYVRIRAKAPTPGVMSGEVSTPDVMISLERELRAITNVRMRPAGAGRRRWYVWPVIVPPIYAKQSLIRAFMPSVWAEARAALEACDRVVFFGYSLPQADIEAEKMFQRALTSNGSAPWIGVIDPSPEVVGRFAKLLPGKSMRRFPDGDSFFASSMFA
jgi:hypothetical protein